MACLYIIIKIQLADCLHIIQHNNLDEGWILMFEWDGITEQNEFTHMRCYTLIDMIRSAITWTLLDLWKCVVVSGSKTLAADPLNHVCCDVGLPWIRIVCRAHTPDVWSDWKSGRCGKFGVTTMNYLSCSSAHSWTVFAVWLGTFSPMKGCSWSAAIFR